jgi:hypothetical protein
MEMGLGDRAMVTVALKACGGSAKRAMAHLLGDDDASRRSPVTSTGFGAADHQVPPPPRRARSPAAMRRRSASRAHRTALSAHRTALPAHRTALPARGAAGSRARRPRPG